MKKIVFLSGTGVLKEGGEFSLIDVIRGIKKDYKILCVCKAKGPLSDILRKFAIETLFCDLKWSRKAKYIFSNYKRFLYLYLKLKRFSPDLIYSNSGRANPFAARLAKKLKAPLITHVRDLFNKVEKDKYLFGYSNKIIACSRSVAKLIEKHNNNVKVIYNGVDSQKFSPSLRFSESNLRKRLGLNDSFLVGNVGTIAYRKGYFEFVEAAEEISKAIPKARFLIVGETLPERGYILEGLKKKVKENNLESKFIFTGFVRDVQRAIASLDILLFPPRYEAFGRVIIEAFACSVPVVSTYSGGPEEIIEDKKDGLLCKIGDTKAMAQAIVSLYQDKRLYVRISENAHKKFLERFTIDRTVREIESVIGEMLGRRQKD